MYRGHVLGDAEAVPLGRDGAARVASACAQHEEQLHEVRAGLAAISCAVELLVRHDDAFSDVARERLEDLLVAEVARLQRLLDGRPQPAAVVPLDDVVRRVAATRRLVGQQVDWHESGAAVVGPADAVTEVVSILLVNANVHAPGAPVHLEISERAGGVRIQVRDEGPGVTPELRRRVFERGVRGPTSSGQGLGLALARRLARGLGGDLVIEDGGPGACLVFTLPSARVDVSA